MRPVLPTVAILAAGCVGHVTNSAAFAVLIEGFGGSTGFRRGGGRRADARHGPVERAQ
jgi:hypothetical protein